MPLNEEDIGKISNIIKGIGKEIVDPIINKTFLPTFEQGKNLTGYIVDLTAEMGDIKLSLKEYGDKQTAIEEELKGIGSGLVELKDNYASLTNQLKNAVESVSSGIESGNNNMEKYRKYLESLNEKVDNTHNVLSAQLKGLSEDMTKCIDYLGKIDGYGIMLGSLNQLASGISTQLNMMQGELKSSKEPSEGITMGQYVLPSRFKIPEYTELKDKEINKEEIVGSLKELREVLEKEGLIGQELITAIQNAKNNIVSNITPRGNLIGFLQPLEKSLGAIQNNKLPAEYREVIMGEVDTAIGFYNKVKVIKTEK